MTSGQITGSQKELLEILRSFRVDTQKALVQPSVDERPRVIVIAGPTACGKTELSLELAEKLGGEVISGDSMQLYRGMDIGTAKATEEERERVLHHMVDVRDVGDPMTVVDFYHESKKAIRSIIGSGFYIHSLIYGPPKGPPPNPEIRAALEEELEATGADALYQRLSSMDPTYAATITCHDKQKIIRGLEIIATTGRSVSQFRWPKIRPVDYNFRCWFLHRPRPVLSERVNQRCEEMLDTGFLDEVKALLGQGLLDNSSAAQAIGYRQALEFLQSPQSDEDFIRFVASFKRATRRYVKRQLTWFNKEPLFDWLDVEELSREEAVKQIYEDYHTR